MVHTLAQVGGEALVVELELHLEEALFFAAVDRQVTMRGDTRHGLGVRVVSFEACALAFGGLLHGGADDLGVAREHVAAERADVGALGHDLGDDVAGTGQRCIDVGHLGAEVVTRVVAWLAVARLRHDARGKRREAALAGRAGARLTLLLKRQVEVFERGLGGRGEQGALEVRGEQAVLAQRAEDGGATFVELDELGPRLVDAADDDLVEAARLLFSVTRDERHRGAAVEQREHCVDARRRDGRGLGQEEVAHARDERWIV